MPVNTSFEQWLEKLEALRAGVQEDPDRFTKTFPLWKLGLFHVNPYQLDVQRSTVSVTETEVTVLAEPDSYFDLHRFQAAIVVFMNTYSISQSLRFTFTDFAKAARFLEYLGKDTLLIPKRKGTTPIGYLEASGIPYVQMQVGRKTYIKIL